MLMCGILCIMYVFNAMFNVDDILYDLHDLY